VKMGLESVTDEKEYFCPLRVLHSFFLAATHQ
jgi:hypothetical protein